MLFLDLDGTLLASDNVIRKHTREKLIEAREAGVKMAICTGRTGLGLSQEIGNILAPDGPHIFESGAAIIKLNGEILDAFPIEKNVAVALADLAMEMSEKYDTAAEFYTTNGIFVSRKTDDSILHAKALKIDPDLVQEADVREVVKDHELVRVQWVSLPHVMEEVLARPVAGVTVAVASAHAIPHCLFASVTREGIDKGTAVKIVANKYWNADIADCYAAGDSDGDVPMLDVVGHPYIMGSARPGLLEKYNTLADVEHEGIIELLDILISQTK